MPRDGARVRRCSKKASAKRSTIKCVRHPGQKRRATNQSHNSRAPCACHVQSRGALPFFTRFYVASPIPLPADAAQSLLAAARGGRMLTARENFRSSELAPVITTTLSLSRAIRFQFFL